MSSLYKRISQVSNRQSFLYRFIWFGCLSACIPVLLIGGVYYQLSMKAAVNEAGQISDSSLSNAKDRLERIFGSVERTSLQLTTNPLIRNSFFDSDSNEKILAHLEILKLLQVANSSNDFIEDTILYDDVSEDILNNEHGFVIKKMYRLRPVLDFLMHFEPKDQCLLINQPFMEETLACVRFLAPTNARTTRGLLITKLKKDLIQKYLEGPIVYSAKQSMLVLDSSNHILVHTGKHFQDETGILNDPSIRTIIRSERAKDSFMMEDGKGARYFYSFRKTELGRTYISKIAEADVAEHMSWIRWAIILTILLFINIGIAITVFASLKAYRPIRQLVELGEKLNKNHPPATRPENDLHFIQDSWIYLNEQSQKINRYMQKWEPTIKESFYLRLLERGSFERGSLPIEELEPDLARLHENHAFAVLIVHLENMHKETRFQRNDGPILSFIMKNVMTEVLQKQESIDGVVCINRSGLGSAIVFFPRSMPEEEMRKAESRFASELVHAFRSHLKLDVCIGIGGIYPDLSGISTSHSEAFKALQYRLYEEQNQVIIYRELENQKRHAAFHYPFYIEEMLMDHLEGRRLKEAKDNLQEYLVAVRSSKSHTIISQCYSLLLSTMCKSLIKKGFSQLYDQDLLASLQERKTTADVYDWFIHTIFPYYGMESQASNPMGTVVQKVSQYIQEHVHDDISLIQCAELVGISPPHLSKMFKKEMGIHFLDYVLDCKIKEAQRLLATTTLSTREIAEQIGYTERSLIRMFQKYTHMTPSQFRTHSSA
ncbi:helix-turn-helix domain-containing protein [Paenibacillus cremeus]|uniref:Helix-turn-helix transcriptional regulator n=1 Tax=Paenibacillus cremeus TaxID=2163881 RepID=A0A559KFR8_9BACL|nr:helix-turn-helix domain-containing protein [Paenibacillus cremeus]TVY10948.1 helix-turn-helix transcriptional regulator [Paenibacillus cremeus]